LVLVLEAGFNKRQSRPKRASSSTPGRNAELHCCSQK
jgi:hypothetical protein